MLKIIFVCAQALLIQGISAQCVGSSWGYWGAPCAKWEAATLSASNGPGVAVSTASPYIPAGVSVLSENAYEGTLAAEGVLPFLGTVAVEGEMPSFGAGVVAYNCGSGVVGITSENGAGIVGIDRLGYGAIGAPLAGLPLAGAAINGAAINEATLAVPLAGAWGAPCDAYNPAFLAASNGPGLVVSSASNLVPSGVSVQSENAYEGTLAVGGAVPFLGTVAVESAVPTTGAGAIAYGCGVGAVGITAEDIRLGLGLASPFGVARSNWGCAV